jgi:hypothetical protein
MNINFTYVFFALLFSVVYSSTAFCQSTKQAKLDSLRNKLTKDSAHIYRFKKVKFLFALDSRNSFIQTKTKTPVSVKGLQIGVILHEKHSLGLGFYSILNTQQTHPIVDEKQKTINVNLKMSYSTFFYEYLFIDTKRWEIGFPLEVGSGNYKISVTDSLGKPTPGFKDTLQKKIILLGAGLNVDFKIWKWLGLNAMGGYRLVGGNEPNKINFNGAFYSVGIHIYLGELVKMGRLGLKRRSYRNEVEKINRSQN